MATAGGPDIERNGLVFGYDTGYGVADNSTPTRHYLGFPVTNMLSYGAAFNSWAKARNSGSYPTVDVKVSKGPFPGTLADRLSLPSDGSYPRIYQNFTPSSTATHTFSIWLKGETEGQGCFVGAFRNSPWSLPSSTTFNITTEWVNYSFNINPQDTSSMQLYIGSHNSHGGKSFLMYGALLQTGGTKTVFTDGTRSSTQSLIDLTRTRTIDVSNVSFDSTGQPTFDGTNDSIVLADPGVSSSTGFSIELVIKPGNASSSPMVITPNSGGIDHFVRFNGNGTLYLRMIPAADSSAQDFVTSSTLSSSNYHHVIFTFKQSEGGKAFYNGSLENSASANFTALDWTSTWRVGQRGNNTYFYQGELPILKIYNRALTASEVLQNYNAYKNRFNI